MRDELSHTGTAGQLTLLLSLKRYMYVCSQKYWKTAIILCSNEATNIDIQSKITYAFI